MKKFLTLTALFTVATAIAQSIVVVDMEEILARHPNTPSDKKVLESTLADYTQERDELRQGLDKQQAELERKIKEAQNPMLAPAKADELRKACEVAFRQLEQDQIAAEQKMAERTRQLAEMEKRLIKRTTDEIQRKIADYAIMQGYDLVLYKNLVPYGTTDLDITEEIVVLCGGKAKEPAVKAPVKDTVAPVVAPKAPVKEVVAPVVAPKAPAVEAPVRDLGTPAQELKAPLKVEVVTPVVDATEADLSAE